MEPIRNSVESDAAADQGVRRRTEFAASLAEKYQGPLLSYIREQVRNDNDADDILQNVFVKVCRKPEGVDSSVNISAWLFTIALNAIRDFRRRRCTKLQRSMSSLEAGAVGRQDGNWSPRNALEERHGLPLPLASLVQAEEQALLHDAVGSLSDDEGELLRLFYVDGLTYAEIAARVGRSLTAIGPALTRARKKLRKLMDQHDNDTPGIGGAV